MKTYQKKNMEQETEDFPDHHHFTCRTGICRDSNSRREPGLF